MFPNRTPLSSLPFVGFRKDRIGARVIALLNVIRIKETMGCQGRLLWLSERNGPYPDLKDPRDCFSQEVIASHIKIVKDAPDLTDRRLLSSLAPSISSDVLQRSLQNGQKYYTGTSLSIDMLMNESAEDVGRDVARIASELKLADPVERCLAEVRKKIADEWPDVAPVAIHVRRGNILDDHYWSRSGWSAKYVPDEFYEAVIGRAEGHVLAFSDTPDALRHLAKGNPRVIIVDDLLKSYKLTQAAQDLVELSLMAGCAQVFAPLASSFSSAAGVMSNTPGKPLPDSLPPHLRIPAYEALVRRVMYEHYSFYLPGDLAQSTHHAASYGMTGGMNAAAFSSFVEVCSARTELMDDHPFLYKDMARAALKLGQFDLARKMVESALSSPHLQRRDLQGCQAVMLELQMKSEPTDRATKLHDPRVTEALDLLFGSAGYWRVAVEAALWPMTKRGGEVGDLLLIDQPALQDVLSLENARWEGNPDAIPQTAPNAWLILSEWSELVGSPALLERIIPAGGLWPRLKLMRPAAIEIEERLFKGDPSSAAERTAAGGPQLWSALGLIATQLRLYGRLNRSFAVLDMLSPHLQDDALHLKRLAATNAAASAWPTAMRLLDQAIAAAPQSGLLYLTKGIWSQQCGDFSAAQNAYMYAVENTPEMEMVRRRVGLLEQAIRVAN